MATVVPEGYGLASWIFTGPFGTDPFVFTMGVDLNNAGPDFVTPANKLKACFTTSPLLDRLDSDFTLERVLLAVGQPGGELPSVSSDTPPVSGNRNGQSPPVAVSLLVNKTTNLLGRKGRGRFFIPGVLTDEDVGLSGIISNSLRDDLQEEVTEFLTLFASEIPGSDPPLDVVIGPVLLHAADSGDVDPTPLTGVQVSPKVGILKRRLR